MTEYTQFEHFPGYAQELKELKSFPHFKNRIKVYLSNHFISRVFFSWVRLKWYRRFMGFKIGPASSILTDFKVSTTGNLTVGPNTVINNSCRFDNRFPIQIGSNVSITYGTHIFTKGHDIDDPKFKTNGGGVVIEDYVWICANAIILPGVRLSKGCVVLPGAVVHKDVAEYQVVGGNPAAVVKERSRNLDYRLNWNPWVPFFG